MEDRVEQRVVRAGQLELAGEGRVDAFGQPRPDDPQRLRLGVGEEEHREVGADAPADRVEDGVDARHRPLRRGHALHDVGEEPERRVPLRHDGTVGTAAGHWPAVIPFSDGGTLSRLTG